MYKGKHVMKGNNFNWLAFFIGFWLVVLLMTLFTMEPKASTYKEKGRIPGDEIVAKEQYEIDAEELAAIPWEISPVEWKEHKEILTCSAYCSCPKCCGKWSGGPTSSGVMPTAKHTLAVDSKNPYFKTGTQVIINGIIYTVEDTGNLAKYGRQLDIYMDNHEEAKQFGVQQLEVIWYEH